MLLMIIMQMDEQERLVVIRFGRSWEPECMRQDEILISIVCIYLVRGIY